jgi:hypothetical protein
MAIGYGMTFAPMYAATTGGVPVRQAGLASGLITTSQQMGGPVGPAVLSGIAASFTASLIRDSGRQALTSGYDLAIAVALAFTLLAAIIASPLSIITTTALAGVGVLTGVDQILGYRAELDVEMLGGAAQDVERLLSGDPLSLHEDPHGLADRLSA